MIVLFMVLSFPLKLYFAADADFQLRAGATFLYPNDNVDVVRLVRFVKADDLADRLAVHIQGLADNDAATPAHLEKSEIGNSIGRAARFLVRLVGGDEFMN